MLKSLSLLLSLSLSLPLVIFHTQTAPLCSAPSTHNADSRCLHATLNLRVPAVVFSKHPFRRTVPLRLHEDLRKAQTPSNTGNAMAATFADATTQLSFAEFCERCILSKAPPPRNIPLPQSKHIGTCNGISSSVIVAASCLSLACSAPPPLPGLEDQARLCFLFFSEAAPVRLHSHKNPALISPSTFYPSTSTSASQPSVRPNTHRSFISYPHRGVQVPSSSGNPLCHLCRPTRWSWSIPKAPTCRSAHGKIRTAPKLLDLATFTMRTVTLCIINIASPILQWNPGPARKKPHPDHCSNLWTYLRSHLTKSQRSRVPCFRQVHRVHRKHGLRHLAQQRHLGAQPCGLRMSRSVIKLKILGAWCYLLFADSYDDLPFLAFPQSRSAPSTSTDLLRRLQRRLHWRWLFGDVFAVPEFSAPGNSPLWGLGALEEAES